MSALIPLSSYTKEQFTQIIKLLTLIPIDKDAEKRKKFKFGGKQIPTAPKENIRMYRIEYKDGQPFIRAPFRFASGILNTIVNRDREYPRVEYNFTGNLREHQVSIIQEAYMQLYSYGTTSLNVYTGCGKTVMSSFLAGQVGLISCVLINLQSLIASWYNTFTTHFPELKDRIWIVGETPLPANVALIICMEGRLSQIDEELRKSIGCMIVDEAHLFCTPSKVDALLTLEPKYIICCTATLDRNDGMEVMMHSIVGTHGVERFSEKPFKLFKVNTNIKIEEEAGMYGLNYSALVNEQANCVERNLMALNIINGNPGHKFMVFCKTKEHVDNIAQLCKHYSIDYDVLYGSKKKFEEKRVMIFSISKAGTGFDMSAYIGEMFSGVNPDTLIMMGTMKAEAKLKQVLGRVLRHPQPSFVYLIDKNAVEKRHFTETKEMFTSMKGEIIEVDYDGSVAGGGVRLDPIV